jgi:hypothetical protein
MSVPTITSLSPISGLTKGRNIVIITGTSFRLPDPPPAEGKTDGALPLSVKVYFEGVECEYAEASESTKIYCRVPQWAGQYTSMPFNLDVKVENVDASGTLIPGETVTTVGAYQMKRANLADESSIQGVIRELIRIFRRHLLENTHFSMSRDYEGIQLDFERDKPDLPVCYLARPRFPVNRLNSCNRQDYVESDQPDEWTRKKEPIVTDFAFEIIIVADNQKHMNSLNQSLLLLFRDVTEVKYNNKEYELRMPFNNYPVGVTIPNMQNILSLRAGCLIKGVQVDDTDGTIIERGWDTTEVDTETQKK